MDIETYLKSEAAREDVRALLALWIPHHGTTQSHIGHEGRIWHASLAQAWTHIEVTNDREQRPAVYCRRDGERFIVSDLGEGMKAFALRTGYFGDPNELPSPFWRTVPEAVACWPDGCRWHGGALWADGAERTENDWIGKGVKAEDLAETICLLMLASYKVANLDRGMS